jgi:hypothetical protein
MSNSVKIKIDPCMNQWPVLFYNRYGHYLTINCATMLSYATFLFCSNKVPDDDVQLSVEITY